MLNPSPIVSSPSRTPAPRALASAAAAVLHGACPLTVSDIAPDHPALAPAVRELAAMTGDPVPAAYAIPRCEDLVGLDPREQYPFPADAHEAEDHHAWAQANGLTDPDTDEDTDEGPDADDDYWFGRD